MLEVKGSALTTLPLFVKTQFQDAGLQKWLAALSPESRAILGQNIIATSWYPFKPAIADPNRKICEIFYGGNIRGAWEAGRFSAEHGLKGIYKLFVRLGSPSFIIQRASSIFTTYYRPSAMAAREDGSKGAIVTITQFPEPDATVEARIAGWMERALEISGCKGIRLTIPQSLTKGNPITEYRIAWL